MYHLTSESVQVYIIRWLGRDDKEKDNMTNGIRETLVEKTRSQKICRSPHQESKNLVAVSCVV